MFRPQLLAISWLLFFLDAAHARHWPCNWKVHLGPFKPQEVGWQVFCNAPKGQDNVYRCDEAIGNHFNRKVADFGMLKPGVLELSEHTP